MNEKNQVKAKRAPTFDEALAHIHQWHKGKYNPRAGFTLEEAVAVIGKHLEEK